jgi:predicted flap endonuclease-1-like 5' DNA nuclease
MTLPFLPDVPKIDPEKGPNLFAGAASPLWLIFGGAAMAGATWWWWSSRWREAVNLEAMMGAAPASKVVFDPVVEAPVAAVEALDVPAQVAAATAEILQAPAEVAAAIVEAVVAPTETVSEEAEAAAIETAETVLAAPPPVVEAAAEKVEAAPDDLTLLVGIGPKLAASLAELGVTRFAQIAAWGPEELGSFDKLLNLRGRAERDAWVAQAKRLASA